MRSRITGGTPITSEFLESRLKKALDTRNLEETRFRANHVYQWTIMFCDVSRTLKEALETDDAVLNQLTAEYRQLVKDIVSSFNPPFTASGDGPQVVVCFDNPEHAADAAIEIQTALKEWRYRDDGGQFFRPSIGLHSGDFVIKDNDLKQCNACNLGKRIETQAHSGEIYVSHPTYEKLLQLTNYKLEFITEKELKNIPELQKIYMLRWQESKIQTVDEKTGRPAAGEESTLSGAQEQDEEPAIEQYRGILICDVAGSTRKFWNLGDREGNLLIDIFKKEVFMILRKYKAEHIENREGDMIVACFDMEKPILNVQAAVEIQKTFFTRNVNLGNRTREKLETSIGIHVGNILIRNNEIVPTPAYFTCKGIQDLADANEICLTEEVAKLITEYSHLQMTEAGETTIKGFPEPIKIYQLEWYKKGQGNPLQRDNKSRPLTAFPFKK